MQTATQLSGRWRLVRAVAVSAAIAAFCAALATGRLGLLPPQLKESKWQIAAASTHVLVDAREPITDRRALPQDVDTLTKHAELLGRVMATRPLVVRTARLAGVDPDDITATAPATFGPRVLTEADSEQRSNELLASRRRYRIEVQARPTLPIIDVYTQAPSTRQAARLADATVRALGEYVRDLARRQGVERAHLPVMRQVGKANAAVINGGTGLAVATIAFVVVFALCLGAFLLLPRLRRNVVRPKRPAAASADDDWPHTTRLLPWMLAGFIAVIWLVPFDAIELGAALPIDLKFDRLLLPIVAGTWVLATAVGGRAAPRVRPTWIHAAIGGFVVWAFLSVVHNAPTLNQDLEFDLSLKELPLLLSYVSLFVIAASVVRPSEVRAFLSYTLLLATICALGILWEYRFKQNVFYDWSDKLLPGIFDVGEAEAGAVDDAGRRLVRGPGALPLEAVAMLSMALPVALVSMMQSSDWRGRALNAIAACLLLAAMLATYRKSALLAPVSVVLTLAYFRRRELLKLAPYALVLIVVVQALAPGAIRMTTTQFRPDQLGVATVSDRAVDYDAIRPDLWSHLAFGRGWGSYDSATHRILDSEILHRTVEMGVLGLIAYLLMGVAVVLVARRTIASRHPTWAPPALIGAAVAVSFLAVSFLFDVLSFPHSPYIFFYMSGLVAVVIARERGQSDVREPARRHTDAGRPRGAHSNQRGAAGRTRQRGVRPT